MNKLQTCFIPLIVSTFGLAMGCQPPVVTGLEQYDTANYKPNTDGSGFGGTWIATLNNERVDANPYQGEYERALIRIKAVAGAADTFELTYCDAGGEIVRTEVTAVADTISLQINNTSYVYSTTTNGRMTAPLYYGNGDVRGTQRAVRISSNPDFAAGTVGLDFATDETGIVKHPTACFSEWLQKTLAEDGSDQLNSYQLYLVGESESGITSAKLTTDLFDQLGGGNFGNTWIDGWDGAESFLSGSMDDNINTTKSTVKGIRGTVATEDGPIGDPSTAGSVILDVRL